MDVIIPRRCARCGIHVDGKMVDLRRLYPAPGMCAEHANEVKAEIALKGRSMWPSDWYGHWSRRRQYWQPVAPRKTAESDGAE